MSTEDRANRYTSNEWLVPIGEKAKKVFEPLPRQVAIEVANAILTQEDSGTTDIPWTTVFPSDNLDDVCSRLLTTFRTSDGQTPAYNADLRSAINDLKRIMFEEGALDGQFLACHAGYHLVRVAAGKPEELFTTYRDLARRWPQYAGKWENDLIEQFGIKAISAAEQRHRELFDLLHQNQAIARMDEHPQLQRAGEATSSFISRAFESLNITNVAGLETAVRLLNKRHDGYRRASYQLRGIPTSD
ncbi:hypothetical protein HYU95_01085 [Candidatus Daviesbacteria bacterium]|nr:hypothetical protein [Candidatus Daviesbacteria bacterium]